MAVNIYRMDFYTLKGTKMRVDITDIDVPIVGPPTVALLKGAKSCCILNYPNSSEDVLDPIRGSELQVTFMSQYINESGVPSTLSSGTFYRTTPVSLLVQLYNIDSTPELKWSGFTTSDGMEDPYLSHPFPVTLRCVDNLGQLKYKPFLKADGTGYFTALNGIQTLTSCLAHTSLSLNFWTSINVFNTSDVAGTNIDPLALYYFSYDITEVDGVPKSCYDVLKMLLDSFDAYIIQDDGVWKVIRYKQILNNNRPVREYNYLGAFVAAYPYGGLQNMDIAPRKIISQSGLIRYKSGIVKSTKKTPLVRRNVFTQDSQNFSFEVGATEGGSPVIGWDLQLATDDTTSTAVYTALSGENYRGKSKWALLNKIRVGNLFPTLFQTHIGNSLNYAITANNFDTYEFVFFAKFLNNRLPSQKQDIYLNTRLMFTPTTGAPVWWNRANNTWAGEQSFQVKLDEGWNRISVPFTTPAGVSGGVRIRFGRCFFWNFATANTLSTKDCLIDDIHLFTHTFNPTATNGISTQMLNLESNYIQTNAQQDDKSLSTPLLNDYWTGITAGGTTTDRPEANCLHKLSGPYTIGSWFEYLGDFSNKQFLDISNRSIVSNRKETLRFLDMVIYSDYYKDFKIDYLCNMNSITGFYTTYEAKVDFSESKVDIRIQELKLGEAAGFYSQQITK